MKRYEVIVRKEPRQANDADFYMEIKETKREAEARAAILRANGRTATVRKQK